MFIWFSFILQPDKNHLVFGLNLEIGTNYGPTISFITIHRCGTNIYKIIYKMFVDLVNNYLYGDLEELLRC